MRFNQIRKKIYAKGEGLGPGSYPIHKMSGGPIQTFGSRFDSNLGRRSALNIRKDEGPGPGSYKLPTSLNLKGRHPSAIPRTTFGT